MKSARWASMSGRRGVRLAFTAVALLTVAALYYLFDPVQSAWAPKCAFHSITGLDCPGCGSQRMLHALLHGRLAEAWAANPFILCMIPLLGAMALAAIYRVQHPRFYAVMNSLPMIIVVVLLLFAWTLLRNILL